MRDVPAESSNLQIVVHNDEETPWEFVVGLSRSVFGLSEAEAKVLSSIVEKHGRAMCGPFPPAIAEAMLATAQQRIKDAGHRLLITVSPIGSDTNDGMSQCGFCGKIAGSEQTLFKGQSALICDNCLLLGANHLSEVTRKKKFKYAHEAIRWHFAGVSHDEIVTTSRRFPGHMRADVQVALEKLFSGSPIRFFGLYEQHRYETLTYSALTREGQNAITICTRTVIT